MQNIVNALLPIGSAIVLAAVSSCTTTSHSPTELTVVNFDFHSSYIFTTPAHQNSWGYVNFNLTNRAVDHEAICSASSSQLQDFFYGDFRYNCIVPANGDKATFTFSRPSGELIINQTWSCLGGSRFNAEGSVKLNLLCHDSSWQNPNWKPGQIYSTRNIDCDKVTVSVPIESISAVS